MPRVTYIEFNGVEHTVEVPVGTTLMRGAVDNNAPGIDAGLDKTGLPEPGSQEATMLSFAAAAQPNSRLSCQIKMQQDLAGIALRMPEGQH